MLSRKRIIFALILLALLLTNPNMEDYKGYLKYKVQSQVQVYDSGLISSVANFAIDRVEIVTARTNFVIFSIYDTNLYIKNYKTIGIFKMFFVISE
jgi:hypothetical protein